MSCHKVARKKEIMINKKKGLDCLENSPHHRKCMENKHTDFFSKTLNSIQA